MFACQVRHTVSWNLHWNFIKKKSKINALHVSDSDTLKKIYFMLAVFSFAKVVLNLVSKHDAALLP